MLDQLKYALGLGGLVTFYGLVSLIVYFVGDRFGVGYTERIVIIALILLTLPFVLVGGYLIARRSKKKAQAEEAAAAAGTDASASQSAAPSKLAAPTGNYDELTTGAEEAVQFMKSSNLGAGKDAVYALPWYIVAGTPKSGKTSLVLGSGLNFQNLPSQRQSEQKFIRPTRSVDWRVTSDAVFLDTAGRYQTEGADQDEWASLLDTVKKYRGQRPLDGMLLAVSAERLMHSDESEIEQMAKVLRQRIDEAITRTKTRFPIYLVFTHADAIEGFRDSFSTSQREGEALVWGATIPLEQSANAHALFDGEYDLLQSSVLKRRLVRLSAPFAPVRQLKIFNFPLHFGSARRKIGSFVSTLFRPNPFSESPHLRGFYFTAIPANRQPVKGGAAGQTMIGGGQTVGQSFFSQKLFRDVVLRDKDLVATIQAQKVKPPIMGWLLTVLGAFLIFLLLGLTAYSLYANKQMVDEAARRGDAVLTIVKADTGKNPLDKKPEEARSEIDATEELRRSLVELDNNERNGAPYLMRFGLYSGNRLYHEKLLPVYFNAVEQRFKRPTVKRLQADLQKFAQSQAVANPAQLTPQEEENLGKHYDLLKAYLMLSGDYKDRAEATFLSTTLADYWKTESKNPSGSDLVSQQQLDFYSKQVDRDEFPRIQLDNGLVDSVRKKLQAFPAVFRYYKRVTTDISKKVEPISADTLLAGRSAGVIEGGYTVPGAYTIEGYQQNMKAAIVNAQQELTKDDWVMGEQAAKAQAQGTEIQRLQEKYFNDYADNWRKFVRGVGVAPYKNKDEMVNALKAFSASESPMGIVAKEIARQTNLSAKQEPDGWIEWIKSFFTSENKTEAGGETEVEKEFKPLFGFVGGAAQTEQSPLSLYGSDLKKLSDALATRSEDQIRQITKDLETEKDTIGLRKTETSINNRLEAFNATSAGQELAEMLKKPINNVSAFFGAGKQEQIRKAWNDTVLPKAKEAEKGYPYEDSGEADLTKLAAYLNPVNGTLSKFYTERLEKYFEDSNGQLKVKDSSDVKFSPEFVAYLNNAFKLREAMFGKNAAPSFGYEFKLQKIDGALVEVTIDGQKIDSNGTGSTTMKFPASSGETGVVMSAASMSGASDTSSANSAQPTVTPTGNTNTAVNPPTTSTVAPSSDSTSLKYPGTWGLFKFFEAGGGASKKQASGEYLLTYKLGGKTVTATVKPAGGDLFDRNVFTSAKAPQSLLK